jgi:hypothetical protein
VTQYGTFAFGADYTVFESRFFVRSGQKSGFWHGQIAAWAKIQNSRRKNFKTLLTFFIYGFIM